MSKEKVIVITSYPSQGKHHDKGVSGLASFAKNTVISMPNMKSIVLAESDSSSPTEYLEGDTQVLRVWDKNSIKLYFQLFSKLLRFRKESNTILLHFELAVFGGNFITGLMPLFILISRAIGYRTVIVMHQVIPDISALSQHLGIPEKGINTYIINMLMHMFNRVLTAAAHKIVVLDQVHKNNLSHLTNFNKVYVIPHGVERVGEIVRKVFNPNRIEILYFGHITWYKGADWLLNAYLDFSKKYPERAKKVHITFAGGQSPTQKNNPTYQNYYTQFISKSEQSSNITVTGFVKEEDFANIFNSSDIQILPYRALMSSSGPLSWAFSYEKPVFISNIISPYIETKDFTKNIERVGLSKNDLVFNLDSPEDLFNNILKIDGGKINKRKELAVMMKESRDWNTLGKMYEEVLSS